MMDQRDSVRRPKREGGVVLFLFFLTTELLEDFATGPVHDVAENRFFEAWQNLPSGMTASSRRGTEE